jgi:hypothetical protein
MKKMIACLAIVAMLFSVNTVFAGKPLHLNFNGSNYTDAGAHMAKNGTTYVTVAAFAKYYGAKLDWNKKSNVLKLNGTVVKNTYGKANVKTGTAPVQALAKALGEKNSSIGWDKETNTLNVTILPPGTMKLTPVVPQMGEHWANPKDMPLGPIYGVYNGKLVFFEYMPAKDLEKTVHDVPGTLVPTPSKIDHFDIDWNPEGHEGYEVPHYDMHMYYITRDEQNKIMPADMAKSASEHGH